MPKPFSHYSIGVPVTYGIVAELERENQKFLYLGLLIGVLLQALLFLLNPSWQSGPVSFHAIPVELIEVSHMPADLVPVPAENTVLLDPRKSFTLGIPMGKFKTKELSTLSLTPDEPGFSLNVEIKGLASDYSAIFDSIELGLDLNFEPVPIKNEVFIDDGIVKGKVVIPPNDRRAIQGYMYIASATGESFAWRDTLNTAAKDLAYILNSFTNVRAKPEFRPMITTRGETYHRNPVLYLTASRLFMFSSNELEYLKRYMYSDGFLIIDNDIDYQSPRHTRKKLTERFQKMFSHATWRTSKLQSRHPVFHSFFDIDTVPAGALQGSEQPAVWGLSLGHTLGLNAVFLEPGYAGLWKDEKNRSQIELAVNIVLYGLARYEEIRDEFKKTRYVSDYTVREW